VKKEPRRALLRGEVWGRFIREKISMGEIIQFNLATGVLSITIIYLNFGADEDEDEDEEDEHEGRRRMTHWQLPSSLKVQLYRP
jgi:hypothetical protein